MDLSSLTRGCSLIPEEDSARMITPPFPKGSAYTQLYTGCVTCFAGCTICQVLALILLLVHDRLKIHLSQSSLLPFYHSNMGIWAGIDVTHFSPHPGIKGDCQGFTDSSQGILHLYRHLAAPTLQVPASVREVGKEDKYVAISQL